MKLQTNTITDALKYINAETLVIFDIDNTLIEPIQEFGGYSWSCAMTEILQAKGWTYQDALYKTTDTLGKIDYLLTFKTVETTTHDVITQLANQQIKIMALTFRSFAIRANTERQLSSVQINLSPHTIHDTETAFDALFGFSHGILYSGLRENKGECLLTFLKKINYYPKDIVFIDDAEHHIDEMDKTVNDYGIPTTCLHYTATAERAEKFSIDESNKNLLNTIGKEQFQSLFKEFI